jgi:hypothetical protein
VGQGGSPGNSTALAWDQAHARAGFTALRFTHAQVRFEFDTVRDTLIAVSARLER